MIKKKFILDDKQLKLITFRNIVDKIKNLIM